MNWVSLAVSGASVALDPAQGNIRALDLGGIAPLHTAHWVGHTVPPGTPAVDANLAGDFLCMPFGASDLTDAPQHGWTANSEWTLQRRDATSLDFELDAKVEGATIRKILHLRPEEPFLYQRHHITGGQGPMTFAHHPMVHMAAGGTLSFSPKYGAITPAEPPEPGRNFLQPGAFSEDLRHFPGVSGPVDLHEYPRRTGHEDFITLIEAEDRGIGWTALCRHAENDIILVLKDLTTLPLTMLWYSNGGRDYAPWDGRHTGVLGIEDGCAPGADGLAAATLDNAVAQAGGVTAAILGGVFTLRHAIGAVARPKGWERVADIRIEAARLTLISPQGEEVSVPFWGGFFAQDGGGASAPAKSPGPVRLTRTPDKTR